MDKVIRNGRVAVAVSPNYGAGWTTENENISPFDPRVIELIEQNRRNEIETLFPDAYACGVSDLEIVWLLIGTKFYIRNHEGYESIISENDLILEA